MIKITSTNDVIIVEGDELTRHYPYNGTLVIPKNSTLVVLDEKSEMVLFKSASNYDTLFTGILGSISIEDEIVTRDNIIEKFNAISNVNVGGNVDLFEVVQSLPTENINDNKVYLLLDSNGSEGNTYVEYLYVNGQWEELGKFKVNVDLSGYALKTDILSAKTDTRYTDFDVQNAVLSGNTILLQNEVTDSRKYHTLGFDKEKTSRLYGLLPYGFILHKNDNSSMCENWDASNNKLTFEYVYNPTIPNYNDISVMIPLGYVKNGSEYSTEILIDCNRDIMTISANGNPFRDNRLISYFGFNLLQIYVDDNPINYTNLANENFVLTDLTGSTKTIKIILGTPSKPDIDMFKSIVQVDDVLPTYLKMGNNNIIYGYYDELVNTSEHPELLNDYIRYSNNEKAYILTDKNTTFKTINGQQILGNGDITIDTNVDLSGYATKTELATKQDVINDLQTIRSGAAKGATALQSVPNTYALKTDILSANTDTRYTDYDVQNAVLSGKTILLQNEVTDSRKYHTLGYEKTITAIVPVSKYINITRDYNNVPSMDTDIESGIRFEVEGDGVGHMYYDINFTLDKINAVTNLMHYEVSYPERDSEGNVTGCGEQVVADVMYDPNTKLLSVPEGGFGFAQIQRSDTNHYLFGGGTDGTEYLENGRWYYNFEQNPLQEGATLTWYISCTTPHQYCDYSVTINGLFYQEGSVTTDDKPERLNDYIRYANNVKAYILTDKNTTFKTINGKQITGSGNIEVAANVDLSNYATKEELNAKQDTLVSGTNIKTVNGTSLLGSGNIEVAANVDLSSYATKSELNAKQDVITDLDSIRSGAEKGATALQSVPSTYALKTDIPDISVKQDKLTAGNGISITDNIISLEYEYDLFEVVTSLPTENISDNKVYLVLDSNGSEGNTYVEYLYVNGQWEELGKFKANVDLSGYATEEWVNGQGFLKEHQDISNLATKTELNTKQDVITDLETIRSGAAKGATALQSVPSTYALKTDIPDLAPYATKTELNAKQDTITDLETIRSGAALGATALQSVPSTYALKSEIPDITTKQDKLVSGTNIKTVNGTSLLGSGNIEIAKEWIGTQAQYDALSTKDNNTTYYITE